MPRSTRTILRETPAWIWWCAIVMTCLATIPLAAIYRARTTISPKSRIHIIQNMDNQPKFVGQQPNELFLDGRTLRPPVPGAVARGDMLGDTQFFRGVAGEAWVTDFPSQLTVDRELLDRGRDRFNIYCQPCHGAGGFGDGLVHHRAMQLVETGENGTSWVAPKNLHEDAVREQPVGQLFNSITNGVRTMAGYGSQIPTQDRWAIVAYIKALQLSQHAPPETVKDPNGLPRVDRTEGAGE